MAETLIVPTVFASAVLAVWGLLTLVFGEDRRANRRLKDLTVYERGQVEEAEPLLKSFSQRVVIPSTQKIGRTAHALWPTTYRETVARHLEEAGTPYGLNTDRFVFAQLATMAGLVILCVALGLLRDWQTGSTIFLALVSGVLGIWLPDVWLRSRVSSRQKTIARELPDMLDMLTISVEAGMGFDSALAKLVKNSRGPLAEEFGRVLQEVQAGASRKEALRHLAERIDVPELRAFVASIIQADMFGVSIAHVLRTQASELRLRRRQRAEEDAQRAPVKMVFPLIICILPATMIVILGPAVVRIAIVLLGY